MATPRTLVISIDGFAAFYWRDPAARMPTLRRLAERGAVAAGMETVLPSTTWGREVGGRVEHDDVAAAVVVEARRELVDEQVLTTHQGGFHAGTIDLDVLNGGSRADEDYRRQRDGEEPAA